MTENRMKKAGAIASAIVCVLLVASAPVIYFLADAPDSITWAASAIVILLAIGLAYFTVQRLKELDEGLEDAIDNY